jgi:hypothetical protein
VTSHTVTIHSRDTFTVCKSAACATALCVRIADEELGHDVYMNYHLLGHTYPVSVPRSDPRLPDELGFMRRGRERESSLDFLRFRNGHPALPIRWGVEPFLKEKTLYYPQLAKRNLHLPLVVITPPRGAGEGDKRRYEERNNELYAYCAKTNRATFLMMFACLKSRGLFGRLPVELVSYITLAYFGVEP